METRINNVIRIKTSFGGNFFRYWFEFLKPFHTLTEREIDVISELVKRRYELSKVISDPDVLDNEVLSTQTRVLIKEKCKLSDAHFQVIFSKLKREGFIIDGKINKRFIPRIDPDDSQFKMLLLFDIEKINDQQQGD